MSAPPGYVARCTSTNLGAGYSIRLVRSLAGRFTILHLQANHADLPIRAEASIRLIAPAGDLAVHRLAPVVNQRSQNC
jgi:hypothetical protein